MHFKVASLAFKYKHPLLFHKLLKYNKMKQFDTERIKKLHYNIYLLKYRYINNISFIKNKDNDINAT